MSMRNLFALSAMAALLGGGVGLSTSRYIDPLKPLVSGPVLPNLVVDRKNLPKGHIIGYHVFAFGIESIALGAHLRIIVGSEFSYSTPKTKARNLALIEKKLDSFIRGRSLRDLQLFDQFTIEEIPLVS